MCSANFFESLKNDEGLRLQAYQDHLGVWTIGYGTNLEFLTISQRRAEFLLIRELNVKRERAERITDYRNLSPCRKDVVMSMMYQMGVQGTMNFRNMWEALRNEDYVEAGTQMRDSRWWRDPMTQSRAERMAKRMEQDQWQV